MAGNLKFQRGANEKSVSDLRQSVLGTTAWKPVTYPTEDVKCFERKSSQNETVTYTTPSHDDVMT